MYKDVGKRIMALLLSVCMIAGMVDLSGFTVRAAGEYTIDRVVFDDPSSIVFTGEPVTPAFKVYNENNDELKENVDYTVQWGQGADNINRGNNALVTIIGIGDYEDQTKPVNFTINPKNIKDVDIEVPEIVVSEIGTVSGDKLEQLVVTDTGRIGEGKVLRGMWEEWQGNNLDYTYRLENAEVNDLTSNITAKVIVTGTGNYTGTAEKEFEITVMNPEKFTIKTNETSSSGDRKLAILYGDKRYMDGNEVKLNKSQVTVLYDGNPVNDFRLEYEDNTFATMEAKVYAVGTSGNYEGLRTAAPAKFIIYKRLSDGDALPTGTAVRIKVDPDKKYRYKGEGNEVTLEKEDIIFENEDSSETVEESEWNFGNYRNNTSIGKAYVEIIGNSTGRFRGTKEVEFEIVAAALTDDIVQIVGTENFMYDAVTNWVKEFKDNVDTYVKVGDGEENYKRGTDYTVDVRETEGKNSDIYHVTVSYKSGGSFTGGTVNKTFEVKKRPLTDEEIRVELQAYPANGYDYDGTRHEPKVKVFYKNQEIKEGTDYTVSYGRDNTNADELANGENKVIITGSGNNFDKEKEIPIRINPQNINRKMSIVGLTNPTYTGETNKPDGWSVVLDSGATLGAAYYDVTYAPEEPVAANQTVTMTVTAKGNYQGSVSEQYTIQPYNFENGGITITSNRYVPYLGRNLTVEDMGIVVTRTDGRKLVLGTDYSVNLTPDGFTNDLLNQGTITFEVRGINNYQGAQRDTFEIRRCSINDLENQGDLKINSVSNDTPLGVEYDFLIPGEAAIYDRYYAFTGNKIEPGFVVSRGNNTLIRDTDWQVKSYGVNTAIGKATATIEGIKNYVGERTVEFCIKGDISNVDQCTITIAEQIYNAGLITPKTSDVTINFTGQPPLGEGDFDVENKGSGITPVGTPGGTATITGKGNLYFGEKVVDFNVRALNLSSDDLDENGYAIEMEEEYVYSGTGILPKPTITHNDVSLTEHADGNGASGEYTLEYYKVETNVTGGTTETLITADNPARDVGEYKIKITGYGGNYVGTTEKIYKISPYDLGKYYEEEKVEVNGVTDIVLDEIKGNESYSGLAEMKDTDYVVWPQMALTYIPDRQDFGGDAPLPLEKFNEEAGTGVYISTYTENDTIGTATIHIQASEDNKNFTGGFEYKFRIKGDLSKAEVDIDSWKYTPPKDGKETNTPEFKVIYTVTHEDKDDEVIELESDSGVYTTKYTQNESATHADEDTPLNPENPRMGLATLTAVDVPGSTDSVEGDEKSFVGYFVGANVAQFKILQRDLTYALKESEEEGYVWDEDLEVLDLEESYEYTGSPIVPDLKITCKGIELNKNVDNGVVDYTVEAENNLNVYEYDGNGTRLQPTVTVSARKDANGNYVGNYKGSFQKKFVVRPRVISDEVKDDSGIVIQPKTVEVTGVPEIVDFDSGNPITFPEEDIEVTWSGIQNDNPVSTVLNPLTDYTISYDDNRKIGNGYVVITARPESNYTGTYKKKFSIMASIEEVDKDAKYITLTYDMDVPYGGGDNVYPEMRFADHTGPMFEEDVTEDYILQEGVDYVIVSGQDSVQGIGTSVNNVNVANYDPENEAGSPTVVIRGIGNYRGAIKRFYNITPKDLKDESIRVVYANGSGENGDEFYYTGEAITPQYTVFNGDRQMTLGRDYEFVEYGNNSAMSVEGNPATLKIKAVDGGNYTGERVFEFKIVPRNFENMTLTVSSEPQIYDRKEKRPEVTVSYRENGQEVVLGAEDYDVDYDNNINVPVAGAEEQPTVVVTGKGFYTGELSATFEIQPESIAEDNEDIVISGNTAFFTGTGEAIETTFVVQPQDGTPPLTLGIDYEVSSYLNNTEIGTNASALISGKGNYTGERRVSFLIAPVNGVLEMEDIPEQEFTNSPIMPEVKVSLVSPQIETPLPLTRNDYEVRYTDNLKAGTAKVIVTGIGAFETMGTIEKDFTIIPKSIGSEGTIDSAMTLSSIEPQWYGGRPIVPGVELKFQPSSQQPAIREGEETNNPVTLIQGTDYRVTAVNNTMVGEATATITGIGNYTGTIETKFRIHGNMNMVDVAPIPTQDYTGSPVTPVPQVSIGGKAMVEGTDYRVEYSNNVDRGTATITITGTEDWYFGTKIVKFDIARELSSETAVRGVAAVYTYTGAAITPPVRVEDDGNLLVSGVDYDIAYSENVNAGTATITITGKGKYTGGTTASFKISPQQLGRARISPVSDQIYNGQEQNPPITVTAGNTTLENGKDYSVVYVNSAAPGMASVIVKGEGNYTGTQTVNYNIKVPEITGVKVSKYTNKSMTLSWNKNDVVSGYEIYNSKNRRAVRVNKPTTAKGTVSKLKAGTAQTFRVRAYVNKDGQYYYGPFTSVKGATAPNSTKISSLKSAKKKQVTVKWKKVKGATQYEVYRSTSKKGKYKKLATTKKTSYTDKKATGGKKYYYKIRVCKKIDKKNYYSSYSAVKSVKAKK